MRVVPVCTDEDRRCKPSNLTKYIHTYKEYHCVCLLVGIRTRPTPLSSGGGGHTRVRGEGLGSPNSNDWRKSLALCLLCECTTPLPPPACMNRHHYLTFYAPRWCYKTLKLAKAASQKGFSTFKLFLIQKITNNIRCFILSSCIKELGNKCII